MPLNDSRLVCPACGKLVEIDVDRFEDMFDDAPGPGDIVAPTYHGTCMPTSGEQWREFRRDAPSSARVHDRPDT